jgi:hypothetical protein
MPWSASALNQLVAVGRDTPQRSTIVVIRQ